MYLSDMPKAKKKIENDIKSQLSSLIRLIYFEMK